MSSWFYRMKLKYQRFAIPNLAVYVSVCFAVGYMLLAVVPFAGICGLCWHIEKNKEYYDREIDRLYGEY